MTLWPPEALPRSTPRTKRSCAGSASRLTQVSRSAASSGSASSGNASQSDGTAQSAPRPMPAGK
eukprot:10820135-Lingulodinium_polyedra.AAC.1